MTTRWLSGDEQLVWRAYLEATQRLWERLGRELDDSGDVSLGEYEVLVRLSEAPDGSLRMSELADEVVHSRSRLTHTVARMEARGLVARRPCTKDGRGVLCEVTETGRLALAVNAPVHVDGVREHLFEQMDSGEAAVFGRVLTRVAGHLRETRPAAVPSPPTEPETARETLGA